jgi:hypothetical protein
MGLLLATTNAYIEVVTSAAQALHTHADIINSSSSGQTVATQNEIISTATTTTIVSSPSSGNVSNIKQLSLYNAGSGNNTVTVEHYDGITTVTLRSLVLLPGYSLTYEEGQGWYVETASGQILNAVANGAVNMVTSSSALVPTSTSSFVMGGMGALITPAKSGNIEATLYGYLTSSAITVDEGIILQLAYASGSSGPSYQAAATGTVVGKATEYSVPTAAGAAADVRAPVSLGALITGLQVGTTYWVDFQMEGITAEDVSLNNAVLILTEY